MRVICGNLKIPDDDLSPWRMMALVAPPKQVVPSKNSKIAQKLIQSMKKWDILRVKKGFCLHKSKIWDIFQDLIVQIASRKNSIQYPDSERFNEFWIAYFSLKQNQAVLHWENINNQWPSTKPVLFLVLWKGNIKEVFPCSPVKGYTGEKIPPFSSQKILWWDKIKLAGSLLRKARRSSIERI